MRSTSVRNLTLLAVLALAGPALAAGDAVYTHRGTIVGQPVPYTVVPGHLFDLGTVPAGTHITAALSWWDARVDMDVTIFATCGTNPLCSFTDIEIAECDGGPSTAPLAREETTAMRVPETGDYRILVANANAPANTATYDLTVTVQGTHERFEGPVNYLWLLPPKNECRVLNALD